MKYNLEEGVPTSVDLANWEKSVDLNNSCLTEINWKETHPIYDFVSDPVKKASIKKAVEDHINNSKLNELKLKPLYRMFEVRTSDTYYLFSWQDAENTILKSNVTYAQVDGYILENPTTDTRPLYRMFNWRYSDTYYLFDYNSVQNMLNSQNVSYSQIDGYIHTRDMGNMRPLYRMYNARYSDTYYLFDYKSVQNMLKDRNVSYSQIDGYIYMPY